MPAAEHHPHDAAEDKGAGGTQNKPHTSLFSHGVQGPQQAPILNGAIIVETNRNEHNISVSVRIESAQHVVHKSKFGLLQCTVTTEATFEKNSLADSFLRCHVNVTFQNSTVQRIARITPDKKGPHETEQHVERPNFCPFSYGIGKCCAFRSKESHQDIVHIGTVIHDEYHR